MKRLYLTVTNDLLYDQRMDRICTSLAKEYSVTLVGRRLPGSLPLAARPYRQKRLHCFVQKGMGFYIEYNTRLFFYLLFRRLDGICAIDLDTILPCFLVSVLTRAKRFYDAHELFTEMKEVRTRPRVRRFWLAIERFAVPRFRHCYTVGEGLAAEFQKRYGQPFGVIRNLARLRTEMPDASPVPFLLYQGAVNEARGFEQLIPAMRSIDCRLVICGDGNFMTRLRELIFENGVGDKVELRGMLTPADLRTVTRQAFIGLNFTEPDGLNQYLCLPNKFFDYIQAGIPQITNAYPEYRSINDRFEVALLLDTLRPDSIAAAVRRLLTDTSLYERLQSNALRARLSLNWEQEEAALLTIYRNAFAS
ncbi:MAG: glycosyltransferase [Flaviaesturariibacter sp.]|nr:glycosyltransferase [Flaviaesturariibacter sp.]